MKVFQKSTFHSFRFISHNLENRISNVNIDLLPALSDYSETSTLSYEVDRQHSAIKPIRSERTTVTGERYYTNITPKQRNPRNPVS